MTAIRVSPLGIIGAAFLAAPSFAADPIAIAVSSDAELPVTSAASTDWTGFYAGIYGVNQIGTESGSQLGLGVDVGINAQFGMYLVGAELALHGLTDNEGAGETTYGQILGRAGLLATDDVLVYGAGGYGLDLGAPDEQDVLLGGGVELSVSDDVSLRAQYLHAFPAQGENAKDQVTVGANFHF
jgi:outer membrane immunogenic protein